MRMENTPQKTAAPEYQRQVVALTKRRQRSFKRSSRKPLTTEVRGGKRPDLKPRELDGWLIYDDPACSWAYLHTDSDGDAAVSGLRQEREHWVRASERLESSEAINRQRAVADLREQVQAKTISSIELDKAVSRLCQRAPFTGEEGWVRWLVLNKPMPWQLYPWSLELCKLTNPITRESVTVEVTLHFRPGISSSRIAKAARYAARVLPPTIGIKRWRPSLTQKEQEVMRNIFTEQLRQDGPPAKKGRADFYKKIAKQMDNVGVGTVRKYCLPWLDQLGHKRRKVLTDKRDIRSSR